MKLLDYITDVFRRAYQRVFSVDPNTKLIGAQNATSNQNNTTNGTQADEPAITDDNHGRRVSIKDLANGFHRSKDAAVAEVNGSESGDASAPEDSAKTHDTDADDDGSQDPDSGQDHDADDDTSPNDKDSDADDAASMSSFDSAEEDFELLKPKVEALCRQLGLDGTIKISDIKAGSFNRVVRIKTSGETGIATGILRMTRLEKNPHVEVPSPYMADPTKIDPQMREQAVILQHIASAGIAAPNVLAYQSTSDNPVHRPYVLQETATGKPLIDVYDNLPLSAKLSLADSLADFLITMEKTTFERCGRLRSVDNTDVANAVEQTIWKAWPQSMPIQGAVEVSGFEIGFYENTFVGRTTKDVHDFLSEQLRAWTEWDLKKDPDEDSLPQECYRGLKKILHEMEQCGFFESEQSSHLQSLEPRNILYHWDLEPRNIMAMRKASTDQGLEEWEITKVIDWDDVRVMPAVLTRKPPIWLWHFSDAEDHSSIPKIFDNDLDQLSPTRYDAEEGRLNEDNASIRERFERKLVQNLAEIYPNIDRATYMDQAYGRGRWMRLMARFVMTEFAGNHDYDRYDTFKKDWKTARITYGLQVSDSESDSDSDGDDDDDGHSDDNSHSS